MSAISHALAPAGQPPGLNAIMATIAKRAVYVRSAAMKQSMPKTTPPGMADMSRANSQGIDPDAMQVRMIKMMDGMGGMG